MLAQVSKPNLACGAQHSLDNPPPAMPENERKPEELSFEEAMESLEAIVESLEAERLPLERMVESYEKGVSLLRVCRQRIDSARQRVELITADLEGKNVTLSDFPAAETVEVLTSTTAAAATPSPVTPHPSPAAEESPRRAPRRKPEPPAEQSDDEIRLF